MKERNSQTPKPTFDFLTRRIHTVVDKPPQLDLNVGFLSPSIVFIWGRPNMLPLSCL